MDFASLMSAEISKSKPSKDISITSSSKYLKKSDLEAQREQAYIQEQKSRELEKQVKAEQKRKRDDEEAIRHEEREDKKRRMAAESRARREEQEAEEERARRKRLGLPEMPDQEVDKDGTTGSEGPKSADRVDVNDVELDSKFRSLGEPIRLFGEDHAIRLRRYYTLVDIKPALKNDPSRPIQTTLEPVSPSEILIPMPPLQSPPSVPATQEPKASQLKYLYRQLSTYFNLLLAEWHTFLSARPVDQASTPAGRAATQNLTSSVAALRPLFQKFEDQSLPEAGMLLPLCNIVHRIQRREYVRANDEYLKLSIGKAAWPIGVTMVGIHERSAREKLNEGDGKEAHVMGDEVTRRWLQAVKRCLSFAQVKWPPQDLGQLMG